MRNVHKFLNRKTYIIFELKTYIITGLAIISFSQFMYQLFGQTIPNIIWNFFKEIGAVFIFLGVFIFALAWVLRARPRNRPKSYSVVVFDVFGNVSKIDGIRTEFKTHDVAWSYMKRYKECYPLNNFALVSQLPRSIKKTIFRYI